jgi:predicted acylesterase/phospholipase RssA
MLRSHSAEERNPYALSVELQDSWKESLPDAPFEHPRRTTSHMQGQETTNRQFGLALSGGGFRAALYHLGVIGFLRDIQLLSRIRSVSGGSIIGAHMVLNWNR